jgi:paired amphipathic helix protein Sin3a
MISLHYFLSLFQKSKLAVDQNLTPASYASKLQPPPPSPPSLRTTAHQLPIHTLPPAPQAVPVRLSLQSGQNDDHLFFDKVRRMLNNNDIYNEFLKLVNLFTQDFIDTTKLIQQSANFLGDTELMSQFKRIVGWDERKEREAFERDQIMPFGWSRPTILGVLERPSRAQLSAKYGSYRKLASDEVNVPCSGRDEMCRSVLNDEWVSHPSWSSEESGFISHRKNIYEEALHRSEEERHEYDFHIDAITKTIGLLEPISHKIASLQTQEERNTYKLKPNLGGTWRAINSRVVKKIYGRDAGLEVIQCMQDAPAVAIPVVLGRLKTKEEEWKRAQKEWNKVWREVESANYWKALDWRGVWWKGDEKKNLSVRGLVSQIEGVREEQVNRRAGLVDTTFGRTGIRHQLEFMFDSGYESKKDDKDAYVPVLQDAIKLTFSYLDRTQAQISHAERKRIENFLRSFIPLFFCIDVKSFNEAFVVLADASAVIAAEGSEGSDADVGASDFETVTSTSNAGGVKRGNGKKASNTAASNGLANASGADLRKKLLKAEQAKSANQRRSTRGGQQGEATPSAPASRAGSRSGSRATSKSPAVSRRPSPGPMFARDLNEDIGAAMLAQAQELGKKLGAASISSRRGVCFTNTAFYCLLRLLEVGPIFFSCFSFADIEIHRSYILD